MEIGIIGFGKFGRFMAKHLKSKADVFVTSKYDNKKEADEIGVNFVSLEEILKKKIIILAVSMEEFESAIQKIKSSLLPGTLVLDVCSLKVFPCKAMQEFLPKNVEIIGTHPLFGPNSARTSLEGLKIALCNVNASQNTLNKVKEVCESLGLKIIITTPEEHDRQMATSQALTHFIGRSISKSGIKKVELSTKTFDDLMNVSDIINNNADELFESIETLNPYAGAVRKKFIESSIELDNDLRDKENRKSK